MPMCITEKEAEGKICPISMVNSTTVMKCKTKKCMAFASTNILLANREALYYCAMLRGEDGE